MLKRIVKLELKEEKVDDFVSLFHQRENTILSFDGCIEVGIYKDTESNSTYFTYSVWVDAVHLENYRHSAFFKETWGLAKTCFADKAKAWSLLSI
jgi:quinol monooxygenase YgiN